MPGQAEREPQHDRERHDTRAEWLRDLCGCVQDLSLSQDLYHGDEDQARAVAQVLADARRVLVCGNTGADGDVVGSTLALVGRQPQRGVEDEKPLDEVDGLHAGRTRASLVQQPLETSSLSASRPLGHAEMRLFRSHSGDFRFDGRGQMR